MEMNKEKYEQLLLRFALELDEVGVSENLVKIIRDQLERMPNAISACNDETTDRFVYRHGGYMVEAIRTVKLVVKTCK